MKIKSIIAIAAGVVLAACTSQTGFSIKATEAGGGVINVIDLLSGDVITSGEGDEVLHSRVTEKPSRTSGSHDPSGKTNKYENE